MYVLGVQLHTSLFQLVSASGVTSRVSISDTDTIRSLGLPERQWQKH